MYVWLLIVLSMTGQQLALDPFPSEGDCLQSIMQNVAPDLRGRLSCKPLILRVRSDGTAYFTEWTSTDVYTLPQ
jgi:hypothetical protein